ncbi:MAG: shikimate kinase [Microthrixaceae bacterium]
MNTSRPVVLVGLPGSGKSTVAPLLADRLRIGVVDLDELIAQRSGSSVESIFARVGEPGFRLEEVAALEAALAGAPSVIATGGGVVTTAGARSLLAGFPVVWLRATAQTLVSRLTTDATVRPLLAGSRGGDDLVAVLEGLMGERERYYTEVASVVVDVDDLDGQAVSERVLFGLCEVIGVDDG